MSAKKRSGETRNTGKTGTGKNEPAAAPAGRLESFFSGEHRDAGICLVIFLSALFLVILLTNPGLYMNDEWITVNQLHQLDIGHQITMNEGKYGVWQNGTPSPYFTSRKNILMYSLALPLAALPVIKIFGLFADNFRLAVVILWSFIPLLAAAIFSALCPSRARIGSLRITVLAAAAGFLLLAANLLVYSPFIFSAPDAPFEVAAVVMADHLLFAVTMVVLYLTARTIFDGWHKAFFATLAGCACSAYLFWAGNAKDHMATAAAFSLVLLFFVRYLRSRNLRDAACGFFCIGLLAWVRPEVGFSSFLCMGAFVVADNLYRVFQGKETFRDCLLAAGTSLATLIGAVPFFINNIVVSGNPLTPAYLLEQKAKGIGELVQVVPVSHAVNVSQSATGGPLALAGDMAATLGHYFFAVPANPLQDIWGILFFPASGSLGLFFVSPLALLALLLIPLFALRAYRKDFSVDRELVLFLLVAAAAVILAYIPALPGLNASHGIGPDIRYLSPLYLPAALLALVLLEKTVLFARPRELVTRTLRLGILLVPFLLVAMILIDPVWNTYYSNYQTFFNILILAEVLLTVAVVAGYYHARRGPDAFTGLLLPLLIVTALAWQVMMVFLVCPVEKFNGYTFWIPGVDALYHHFIVVTILPH